MGLTVFDYIWLRDDKHNNLLEFPIYVTINNDSIDFHAHFHDIYKDQDNKEQIKHLHNTILSLPLSANLDVKDGLTEELIKGWETDFPRFDDGGSNYLYDLVETAIIDDNEIGLCYADLKIFNWDKEKKTNEQKSIIEEAKDEIRKSNYYTEKKRRKNNYKDISLSHDFFPFKNIIRILILDFLFDLEHSKVFQNSSYYEYISVKLRENFFFNALANKAKYYYYREIAKEDNIENQEKYKIEFFLNNFLLHSEDQWIKSIINPRSDKDFTLKIGEWFDYPEKEMAKIYENGAINAIQLYDTIKQKQKDERSKIKAKIKKMSGNVSKWQLGKFDFANAYKNIRYSFGIHFFLIRLLGCIATAWITLSFSQSIINSFNNIYICCAETILVLLSLVSFTVILVHNEIRKTVPYLKPMKIFLRSIILLFFSFIYSLIIGIITTALISLQYINKTPAEVLHYPNYLIVFSLVAMFLGIFLHLIFPGRKIIEIE